MHMHIARARLLALLDGHLEVRMKAGGLSLGLHLHLHHALRQLIHAQVRAHATVRRRPELALPSVLALQLPLGGGGGLGGGSRQLPLQQLPVAQLLGQTTLHPPPRRLRVAQSKAAGVELRGELRLARLSARRLHHARRGRLAVAAAAALPPQLEKRLA
jgi:hypothetical protein